MVGIGPDSLPPEIGGGTYSVLFGACHRAKRRHALSVGADDVMASLLAATGLGAALGFPAAPRDWQRAAVRVGIRPMSRGIDVRLEQEAARALREAHWTVFGLRSSSPNWDDEVYRAAVTALRMAADDGLPYAGSDCLLRALLADPHGEGSGYLRARQVDMEMLDEAARRRWPVADQEGRTKTVAKALEQAGVLAYPGPRKDGKGRWALYFSTLVAQTGPAMVCLESQAVVEAVRLGHKFVAPSHLILAVLRVEHEMRATGLRPVVPRYAANDFLLADFAVFYRPAIEVADSIGSRGPAAAKQRGRAWRQNPRNPAWMSSAVSVAERARGLGTSAHPTGSLHLVHASLSDQDDTGCEMMRRLSVDPGSVVAETTARLSRLETTT
jgi:Clp amino terminal domain, pathogenicity island component